jgi:hypothetical protein
MVVVDVTYVLLETDVLVWTTVMALHKLVASVAVSETFLHVSCVPTLINFSSFIGFWHISNDKKA